MSLIESGERDSNPRIVALQATAVATEPPPHARRNKVIFLNLATLAIK